MAEKSIYILYGSQTGNSEDIAKDLNEKCKTKDYETKLATLNSVKKASFKEDAKAIIIVCSTTGNGDPPENADGFWRTIKNRSASKEMFEGIPFCVLGLGDTNYDKFCHMGKVIDKRLSELGGNRCLPLACADEATNLEETVEGWKINILNVLNKIMCDNTNSTSTSTSAKSVDAEPISSIDSKQICEPTDNSKYSNILPNGIMQFSELCNLLNITNEMISSPPEANILPKEKLRNESTNLHILETKSNEIIQINEQMNNTSYYHEKPYNAQITHAKWLTNVTTTATNNIITSSQFQLPEGIDGTPEWGSTKRVIHVELSLGNSGMSYTPGDSIGVCCPNPIEHVHFILNRINSKETITVNTNSNNFITLQTNIKWNEIPMTIEELLVYKVDLVSVVRKDTVLALSACCEDKKESTAMRWLCTKGQPGISLWKNFIESQSIGVAELLALFPSCRPSLQVLTACLRPLPPRYYSIACSPLTKPSSVTIALSLVRYTCGIPAVKDNSSTLTETTGTTATPATLSSSVNQYVTVVKRSGLCTSYLERLLARWLQQPQHGNEVEELQSQSQSQSQPPVCIRMFMKQTVTFRLPGSLEYPLILIGPGTGVAPFIGFLDHRAQLEKEIKSCRGQSEVSVGVWRGGYELQSDDLPHEATHQGLFQYLSDQSECRGDVWLFYGCRGEEDFLYKDELKSFVDEHTLTVLESAMSRQQKEKVYVTHRLLARGAEISNLIMEKNAYIYICGDGNKMAKDVHSALKDILQQYGNIGADEVETILTDMKTRRRYVLDIWS
eukprot:gene10187-21232_t